MINPIKGVVDRCLTGPELVALEQTVYDGNILWMMIEANIKQGGTILTVSRFISAGMNMAQKLGGHKDEGETLIAALEMYINHLKSQK